MYHTNHIIRLYTCPVIAASNGSTTMEFMSFSLHRDFIGWHKHTPTVTSQKTDFHPPPFHSLPSPSTIYANAFLFCVRAESPVDNTLARLRPPPYKSQALLRVFCDMLYKLSSLLPWKASLDPKLPLFAPVSFNVPLT